MPHPFDSPPTAEHSAVPSAAGSPPPSAGQSIGPYKLLQKLGEGGMGAVWMAEQAEPVRRLVALKLIRPDRAGGHFLARFEAERQALALMDHPNIAKVLDAGQNPPAVPGGLATPYLAMELVKGVPITQYCDDARLTVRQRVELFVPVCRAVQHAHTKGIIHRDLKPSNILVALYDGVAVPKVIDFGVAKAIHSRLTDRTLVTEVGAVVGTPEYMAPEQADYNALDIDTRADIYSLGVVLYELLSGSPPFDRRRLQEAAILEILRMIKEVDPPTPSKQLSAAGTLPEIAARRRADPDKLPSQLRGELDWIVMKALEKERNRRYATADAFAADLERHLRDEPVLAGPPSAAYRLRKFVRKHRGRVVAAGLLLASLVAGLVGSATQAFRATRAEVDLRQALANETAERQRAGRAALDALNAQSAAETEAYIANLFAAGAALASHEPGYVRPRLDACAPRLRGWEWRYLNARSDASLITLRGHGGMVYSVAFSPTGDRVVTASSDKTAKVWDAQTGRLLATLAGHNDEVRSAVFHPAGDRVLTASYDRTARVWDPANGEQVAEWPHQYGLRSAAYDPTGQRVVILEGEKLVRVRSALTGETAAEPPAASERVIAATFSPTGDRLVFVTASAARVWDVVAGREVCSSFGQGHLFLSASFDPSGQRLAATSADKLARVLDATTGRELAVLRGHESAVLACAFLGSGDRLATASADRSVRVWDVAAAREVAAYRAPDCGVFKLHHSAATAQMAFVGTKGWVRLWNLAGDDAAPVLRGHEHDVTAAVLSPAGDRVATSSRDGTARLWDAASPRDPLVLAGHTSGIRTASIDQSGGRLVTASDDQTARVWDLLTGRQIATLRGHTAGLRMAAFDLAGRRVVTTSGDATARIWHALDGRELVVLRGHGSEVVTAAFDAAGRRVLTTSMDQSVRVWDADSGRQLATVGDKSAAAICAAFSPTGELLATGFSDATVRLHAAADGQQLGVLRGHEWAVNALAFLRDGTRLVTADGEGVIRVWDVPARREVAVLRGHTGRVSRLRLSPGEDRLLSASWDRTARVWDLATAKELTTLRGLTATVVDAQFNPAGDRVVTAMGDGTTRVWDAATGREMITLRGHDAEVAAASFTPAGDRLVSASSDGTARVWDGVPYRERYPGLVAARAAEAVMRDRVASRLKSGDSLDATARWLAGDPTLNEPHRSAGRVVLNQERERRHQAEESRRVDARRLNAAAWPVVARPGADAAAVNRALQQAQRATELAPTNPDYVNTLGVAQFRAGQFVDAVATLMRAEELYAKSANGPQPADWAVIAMAQSKLGKPDDAKTALARARELMKEARHAANEDNQSIFTEAANLIER